MNTGVRTVELNDEQWDQERDAVTRRYLGLSAADFVRNFRDGAYADSQPDDLMTVLSFFPELD